MPCPFHKLKSDLPPLTSRLKELPIDERGYPVPFFVAWVNGKPDFRVADAAKLKRCIQSKLCWVCGQPLGSNKAFVIGPMCCVNRTTAEPPSHLDCAEWSVKGCPFLSKPQMVRREDEFTESCRPSMGGEMIKRNPAVMVIWVTKSFAFFPDGNGGRLIRVGEPDKVTFWREGRPATRRECLDSIESGLPLLSEMCQGNKECLKELGGYVEAAMKLLPEN